MESIYEHWQKENEVFRQIIEEMKEELQERNEKLREKLHGIQKHEVPKQEPIEYFRDCNG